MKKLVFICMVLMIGCSSWDVDKEDIRKNYPVTPFILTYDDFDGDNYYDRGWLHFEYSYADLRDHEEILSVMDSIAIDNEWEMIVKEKSKRVYTKPFSSYPADSTTQDTLYLEKVGSSKKLKFRWH